MTPPGSSVYTGTKGAVDAITRTLAKELGPRKIRVNSINPGLVETEGVRAAGFDQGDLRKSVEAQTPFGRVGQPSDIAPAVAFLLPLIPRGSQVKRFVSREVFVRPTK